MTFLKHYMNELFHSLSSSISIYIIILSLNSCLYFGIIFRCVSVFFRIWPSLLYYTAFSRVKLLLHFFLKGHFSTGTCRHRKQQHTLGFLHPECLTTLQWDVQFDQFLSLYLQCMGLSCGLTVLNTVLDPCIQVVAVRLSKCHL